MLKTNKLLGAILLIAGTSIGAAVLALPIATAQFGFLPTTALFILCWLATLFAALIMLEANLWLDPGANLISMAEETLGIVGKYVSWVVYLLLLYALMIAYLSGLNELAILAFKNYLNVTLVNWQASVTIVTIVGIILLIGTRAMDYFNRIFVLGLVISFFALCGTISPLVHMDQIIPSNFHGFWIALPITVTAFGYQIIIPSIRSYVGEHPKQLTRAIMLGSTIPLVCYLIWEFLVVGVIPRSGEHSLLHIQESGATIAGLVNTLTYLAHNHLIGILAQLFAFYAIITSFIGVSLSLFDFLSDGFHSNRHGAARVFITLLTFIPPLILVLNFPDLFMRALGYAGALVAVLLIILPCLMVFSGRYIRKEYSIYTTPGGVATLIGLMVFAVAVILIETLY
jgi:tyrosine-specific transport protein